MHFDTKTTLVIGCALALLSSIYLVTCLLHDHRSHSQTRLAKRQYQALKQELKNISDLYKEIRKEFDSISKVNASKKLMKMEIEFMNLLERIDGIEFSKITDDLMLESIKAAKRDLILKIQKDMRRMDDICREYQLEPTGLMH